MATRKTTDDTVTVKMTGAHTYKTGASTRRTLPQGWSGSVPAAIGAAIEKAGKGKIQKPKAADKTKAVKKPTKAVKKPTKAATSAPAATAGAIAPAATGGQAQGGAPASGDGATG